MGARAHDAPPKLADDLRLERGHSRIAAWSISQAATLPTTMPTVAGPGPSYLDAGSGGPENDFTNRNTTFMTWNLLHMARMLKDAGGVPAHGNQRSQWDAGCRFDYPNPDYR